MTEKPTYSPGVSVFTLFSPWHYVCPYCGARNGSACETRNGKPRTTHAARKALGDAARLASEQKGS